MSDIIVDIVIVAFIVLGAVIGVSRGFISMAGKPVKIIAALVFAYSFCKAFAAVAIMPIVVGMLGKLPTAIAEAIATIVAFVLIYIASRILLSLALSLLNAIFDKGIFKILNRILGLLFSAALSIVFVGLIISLFEYLAAIPKLSDVEWLTGFEGGFVYKFFVEHSPIEFLLSFKSQ